MGGLRLAMGNDNEIGAFARGARCDRVQSVTARSPTRARRGADAVFGRRPTPAERPSPRGAGRAALRAGRLPARACERRRGAGPTRLPGSALAGPAGNLARKVALVTRAASRIGRP